MDHHLTVPENRDIQAESFLQRLKDRNDRYANNAKSANTKKAYVSDFTDFQNWCAVQEIALPSLPATPDTVGAYLAELAEVRGYKISTIERRLAAISQAHKTHNYESPTASQRVKDIMHAIRREFAPQRPVRKVRPAVTNVVVRMVEPLGDLLIDVRDRALLLIGFAGAFRRSELAGLLVTDIVEVEDGLKITLRQSKTDQEGKGMTRGIPYGRNEHTCPVRAWRAWLVASGITGGYAFRGLGHANTPVIGEALTDRSIARMIKSRAKAVGLDPKQFSGHSLRSGLATAGAQAGLEERHIMRQTGHRDLKTFRGYVHEGSLFTDNVSGKVGL